MYPVSSAYRAAVQLHRSQGVRNRSYAQIYIGQFDASARTDAVVTINDAGIDFASVITNVNTDSKQGAAYTTWEQDFFRLDGVQSFVPAVSADVKRQGFISSQMSGADGSFATPIVLTIQFANLHRMSGITLLFDDTAEAYCDNFNVSTYFNGELVESNNVANSAPLYEGILTLDYHNKMVITFNSTARPYQRLHLQQLLFGIGFVYSNEEIMDISFNRSTSPVSLELPSSKPTFSLYNENGIFSPDSTSSVSSFFSQDQECKVSFGQDVSGNGTIEWVGTGKFWLSKWSVDGITAKFEAVDIIERMSATTYRRGTYGNKTARAMIDDVMADFGYDNYDANNPELNNTYIANPLPIASHAECLQLIANYAMCTLEPDEDGMIIFRRRTDPAPANVIPLSTASFLVGSTAANLSSPNTVKEYASFEPDGFALSGDMLFVPDDTNYENAGLVWGLFPDENGKYAFTYGDATKPLKPTAGPAICIDFAANVSWGSTTLDFGSMGDGYSVRLRGFRDAGSSTYTVVYDKVFPVTASPLTIVDYFS